MSHFLAYIASLVWGPVLVVAILCTGIIFTIKLRFIQLRLPALILRSGGSDFPVEQVKKAGVDLTSKEPFEAVVKRMSELVDQLEKLLAE